MIPEFDEEGRAEVALKDGRAMSILNEQRTAYIRSVMSPFMYDPATDSAAADADSYEVAFADAPEGSPDRGFIPDGWTQYIDMDRTDYVWRIFGHVPHQVVHDYLDEHGAPS